MLLRRTLLCVSNTLYIADSFCWMERRLMPTKGETSHFVSTAANWKTFVRCKSIKTNTLFSTQCLSSLKSN